MPLTELQRQILSVLATDRTGESYLAGGAALHFSPQSARYSHDLDFFHDSARQVAEAFESDTELLRAAEFGVDLAFSQPGFIRALVERDGHATQIDWAHDSAWRFMPLVREDLGGLLLHEIDLSVNKTLALAGRDEARDLVDILSINDRILGLGPLVWAAVGKDPGFTPLSLLEQLRRAGRYRSEDIARLDLAVPFDLHEGKDRWLRALAEAESFIQDRPADEIGCLYYAAGEDRFVEPARDSGLDEQGIVPHYGAPGGVVPQPARTELL